MGPICLYVDLAQLLAIFFYALDHLIGVSLREVHLKFFNLVKIYYDKKLFSCLICIKCNWQRLFGQLVGRLDLSFGGVLVHQHLLKVESGQNLAWALLPGPCESRRITEIWDPRR